jgi:hypothetical protein
MSKTGTSPQETSPQPANDNAAATASVVARPPPPVMGKLVDKKV